MRIFSSVDKYRTLLKPFEPVYSRYVAGAFVRQLLVVVGGYSLVWVLRTCTGNRSMPAWAFVAALVLFDIGLLRLDLALNWLFASRVSFPMFGFLRTMALNKAFSMPQEWHQRQNTGEMVGKVNAGVGKVVQTSEALGRELLPAIIRTILSLAPLLWFSPFSAPFIAAAAVWFTWTALRENRARYPYRKSRYRDYGRDFGMFSECMEYVQPIVNFGQTARILGDYSALQSKIAADGIEETRIATGFTWRRSLLLSVAKRACLGVWIWQYRSGTLDAAMVMYLSTLLEDLFNSFAGYAGLFERVQDGVEPARMLMGLLQETSPMADSSDKLPVAVSGMVGIEMRNVHFAYSNGASVLNDFSLTVEPGTIVGIVGRTGIGKTTIQQLLCRTYDAQQGQILISGEDVRKWPLEQLRGMFSSVSQNGGVFFSDLTILDTIRFTRPGATNEEVIDAAKCACIHNDILHMPYAYQTRIGQRGVTLSKGQQQRIALAQALIAIHDRKVLVLDEFTSALDARTEQELLRNLAPHLRGRTVVIIAHRLATLRKIADKIIVLDRDGIVEMGAHDELLRHGGQYAELAQLQATA